MIWGQQQVIDSLQKRLSEASDEEQAFLLNRLSFENILVGNLEEAQSFALKAKEKAIATNNLNEEGISYKHTGIILNYLSKISEAQTDYQKAIEIFKQTENFHQLIKVYHNLSNLYLGQGKFSKVFEYLSVAESISREHEIISVPLMGSLSNFYQLTGDFEKSLHYALESLKYAELENDLEGVAYAYNSLGKIYLHNNEIEKAEESYLKSSEIYRELERNLQVAILYNNLGSIYGKQGEFENALEYCYQSLEIKKELHYNEGILFSYLAIGDLYAKMNEKEKAFNYYRDGIELAKETSTDHLLSQFQSKEGVMHFYQKDYEKAEQDLLESNSIAINNNSLELVSNNYYFLSKIDSVRGDFKGALTNFQKYMSVKDSLYNKVKIQQMEEMQIRFETVEKEKEIAQLESEKQMALKERNFERLYKNVAFLGILIFIVLLILLNNRFKIKKKYFEQETELNKSREDELKNKAQISELQTEKLQSDLHLKNRELSTAALAATHKNDILSEIQIKISEVEENSKIENKSSLQYIKRLIKENLNMDKDWESFKLHFESVHPDFYYKLKSACPELSNNDLKHCTYIKVNLSSKEIARIMNISPKSVQMSRYRLKKKFQLSPDQDLFEFIDKELG